MEFYQVIFDEEPIEYLKEIVWFSCWNYFILSSIK